MSFADQVDARAANRSRRNINASEPLEFAVLPGHRLRKRAMNIVSDDAHVRSLLRPLVQNGSWRATRHLLIRASQRIWESPKGRLCNELGLAAPTSIGGLPTPSCPRCANVRMGSP